MKNIRFIFPIIIVILLTACSSNTLKCTIKNEKFDSKYIVTSKEVTTDAVSSDLDMLSLNHQVVYSNKSQSSLILYVLATGCGVLAILLLISLSVKASKTKQTQS